jgi:hypothetical protein
MTLAKQDDLTCARQHVREIEAARCMNLRERENECVCMCVFILSARKRERV